MFVGHDHLVKDFKNLAKSGRLAHGYIFFGEPEVGKFYFAKHLANLLENGEFRISERPLSDSLILENSSGIDDVLQIKNFLWQTPQSKASKRLLVINNAEDLTPQAQNAILKITEEPPEHSLIILITSQLENLLPVLQSRLQKIYFGRLSDKEMEKAIDLISPMGPISPMRPIINAAFGRPGRLVRLQSDSLTKEAENYAEQFLKISGVNRSNLIKEVVGLQRDLSDKENKESVFLDIFFEYLILKLRQEPAKNYQLLRSVLHRLFLIKSYNTNKRLQLEAI